MGIPASLRAFIASKREYQGQDVTVLEYPIWSTIAFLAVVAAGPPVTYTLSTAQRVAFSYAVNGDMAAAGLPGVIATQADTNLLNPGQTRNQADVFIYGLSAQFDNTSDPDLLADVCRETDVIIATNAETQIPAGRLEHFPSSGGPFGAGRSNIREPNLGTPGGENGGQGATVGFFSNGNPTSRSYFELGAPIFWAGLANGPDSNLQIICTPRRTITKTSALIRPAGGMVAPFTPATAPKVVVTWRLYAASVSRRGVNAG